MSGTTKAKSTFGPYLKNIRSQKRVTLRDFCKKADADPGNISKIERGVWPPPQDNDILERYAKALAIKEATDEWYRFFDYAAADRGIVPRDIMSDQDVVKMLPVFFRTMRGQKPTEKEMRELVAKIRKS
ncbi:MAG: helix-turn-helix transcriptional regulator [Kiritimatiellia bacterium]|nr:helix-turn-helix transcriptional regulator [Kiritimatiellia bacterium]